MMLTTKLTSMNRQPQSHNRGSYLANPLASVPPFEVPFSPPTRLDSLVTYSSSETAVDTLSYTSSPTTERQDSLSTNASYQSRLKLSIKNKDINLLSILLSNGADAGVYDPHDGYAPIHHCAMKGSISVLREIKRCCPSAIGTLVNLPDICQRRPLHLAATHGHVNMGKLLLSYGACFDAVDENGRTAWDYARKSPKSEFSCMLREFAQRHPELAKGISR